MNISNSTLSKLCLLVAFIFVVSAGYLYFNISPNNINWFITIGIIFTILISSYQLSARYKHNNSLNKLITRDGDLLFCKSAGSVSNSKINTSAIETITILDGYFSIIEKGNGKGYDIFTQNTASEIKQHLLTLFSQEEINRIKVSSDA